jgi:hypothetical protein
MAYDVIPNHTPCFDAATPLAQPRIADDASGYGFPSYMVQVWGQEFIDEHLLRFTFYMDQQSCHRLFD